MTDAKITLYTAGTPNGVKISTVLEELGIAYEVRKIDLGKNEQKEDWFLKINPNGRIPAIVDRTASPAISVFESGAVMLYLADKHDPEHKLSYTYGSPRYWEVVQWLFFMNSGVGPMQGQANHFFRYAPEKIQYAIDRYQNETKRLYSVLEKRLQEQKEGGAGEGPWLVGDHITIADIANYCWINAGFWAGIEWEDKFPALKDWFDRIDKRPAIDRGMNVPSPRMKRQSKEEEDKQAKENSNWILQGQKEDAKELA